MVAPFFKDTICIICKKVTKEGERKNERNEGIGGGNCKSSNKSRMKMMMVDSLFSLLSPCCFVNYALGTRAKPTAESLLIQVKMNIL